MKWHKSIAPDPNLPWPQRFWQKVDAVGDCWEWTASRQKLGYGQWSHGGKVMGERATHRVAWTVLVGPIPEGYWIDHLCRNPSCCNPDHLEAVSPRVNIQRGKNVGRPKASHCQLGHPLAGDNLYVKPNGKRRCRICKRADWHKWNAGETVPAPTSPRLTCKRGHAYSEHAYVDPQGGRHCKVCRAYLQRIRRQNT